MNKYSGQILSKLIDKYERSKNYWQSDNTRRVILNFTQKTLPRYFERKTASYRNDYNQACNYLAAQQYIELEWQKFKEGQVVMRVILNETKEQEIYSFLKRRPLRDKVKALKLLLENYPISQPWLCDFRDYIISRLQHGNSISAYLTLDDMSKNKAILKCLQEIPALDTEMPKRVFSSTILGDSKAFASIEAIVVKILQDFYVAKDSYAEISKEQLLAELGLVNNPQYVYLSGGVTLEFKGNVLNLAKCAPGIALPATWLSEIEVLSINAQRIITIENLTTFHQYALYAGEQEVVLYLGGYHNTVRRQLLLKLAKVMLAKVKLTQDSSIPLYHWGDIDGGGYDILRHLRDKTKLNIKPWRMDAKTLTHYAHLARPLDKNGAKQLSKLASLPIMNDVSKDIERIIELNLKLEQEVIPI